MFPDAQLALQLGRVNPISWWFSAAFSVLPLVELDDSLENQSGMGELINLFHYIL